MPLTAERRIIAEESLIRARGGQSTMNYERIIAGFIARGIPAAEIRPRENVLTYAAWQAAGRQVRKGEKGLKVTTFVPMTKKDDAGNTNTIGRRPWTAAVFHVSQTDPIGQN